MKNSTNLQKVFQQIRQWPVDIDLAKVANWVAEVPVPPKLKWWHRWWTGF